MRAAWKYGVASVIVSQLLLLLNVAVPHWTVAYGGLNIVSAHSFYFEMTHEVLQKYGSIQKKKTVTNCRETTRHRHPSARQPRPDRSPFVQTGCHHAHHCHLADIV